MTVYPVTESFAAEIGDVDLSQPLSEESRAEIAAAFDCYSVLVFPDQRLDQRGQAYTLYIRPRSAATA